MPGKLARPVRREATRKRTRSTGTSPRGRPCRHPEIRPPLPRPVGDGDALAVEINSYRHIYNTIRPHQALGDRTPRQAYLAARPARENAEGCSP